MWMNINKPLYNKAGIMENLYDSFDKTITSVFTFILWIVIIIAIIGVIYSIAKYAERKKRENEKEAMKNAYIGGIKHKYSRYTIEEKIEIYNQLCRHYEVIKKAKNCRFTGNSVDEFLISNSFFERCTKKYNLNINTDYMEFDIQYLYNVLK